MDKASKLANQAKDSIDKLVDTVNLKAHLGSMDSKDTWDKFEKQFDIIREDIKEFKLGIEQETDETKLKAHLALMDAKERWDSLKEEMDHLVTTVGNNADEKFDYARVQMSLAKLDAKDLIDQTKYRNHLEKMGMEIKEEWYSFLVNLDDRVIDFINKFPLK